MTADPAIVFDAATAFWRSSVLFTACDIKLFDALSGEPAPLSVLTERLAGSERGLFGLLESCVAMDLLEKDGDTYRNTQTAETYLTSKSPDSLLTTLALQAATVPMWQGLTGAVRSGAPVIPPGKLLGGDKDLTRRFVVGMHERAVGVAKGMVDAIDLSGRKLLADIGGGPGTYSAMLVARYPDLRARVMDLEPILEISRELLRKAGVADRVETVHCDARNDDFGSGYDAALISGLLHRMTEQACRDIFAKVYAGLPEGGTLIANDLFTTQDGGPEMAVLFGLQMLLTCETGRTHKAADIARWMSEVGFKDPSIKTLPPPLPHTLVIGTK